MPTVRERQEASIGLVSTLSSQDVEDLVDAGYVTLYRAYEATETELEAAATGSYAKIQAYQNPE